MGPIDVFVGWQAVLVAVLVSMTMQLLKTVIDLAHSPATELQGAGPYRSAKLSAGREKRRESRFKTRILMPALPPLLGAVFGLLLPLPESLAAYTAASPLWLALIARAAWGAAAGQFSDYLYSKLKALVQHERRAGVREGGDR